MAYKLTAVILIYDIFLPKNYEANIINQCRDLDDSPGSILSQEF